MLFSSSLSEIRVVSSACLRLLIFFPVILIPACAFSSPALLMMPSAYKLNKQGDDIQPWHTPFPIWNQSVVPCLVLTLASWPAYWFLRRQVRWSSISISLRIFQFVVTHIVKFTIVNRKMERIKRGKEGSRKRRGLPWWSSGWDSLLPMQRGWIWSMVRELEPTSSS